MRHGESEIEALERQKDIEVRSIDRGVERYWQSVGSGMNTSVTDRAIVKMLGPVADGIAEYVSGLVTNRGRKTPADMVMALVDPRKLAFITARTVLSSGTNIVGRLAGAVGELVEQEATLNAFKTSERERVKKAKEDGDTEAHKNLVWCMKRYTKYDQLTAKHKKNTMAKFMARVEQTANMGLTSRDRVMIGTRLIVLLTRFASDWFILRVVPWRELGIDRGIKRSHERVQAIFLTSGADSWFTEAHANAEIRRPWNVPMIVPPTPWEF